MSKDAQEVASDEAEIIAAAFRPLIELTPTQINYIKSTLKIAFYHGVIHATEELQKDRL
jgi:hypothetical protein